MNPFATMNSVNASRVGMQGTPSRYQVPTAGPRALPTMPQSSPNSPLSQPPAPGVQHMFGSQTSAQGRGMMGSFANRAPQYPGGVVPGQQAPQLPGPQAPQFDPNDPNNAALAGYMNGGMR